MDYTITKVSEKPPREYEGSYGKVYYTKVMLQGHDKPVEIGKKQPNSLKVGDIVAGDIKPSQYEADGFKAIKKDFNGGSKFQPKDEASIKAMWSISQSIATGQLDVDDIEAMAKDLFLMVDRVKVVTETILKTSEPNSLEDTNDYDKPINLDNIPF